MLSTILDTVLYSKSLARKICSVRLPLDQAGREVRRVQGVVHPPRPFRGTNHDDIDACRAKLVPQGRSRRVASKRGDDPVGWQPLLVSVRGAYRNPALADGRRLRAQANLHTALGEQRRNGESV